MIFDGGEQNAKQGREEFFDFSFSIFFILFDKKTYKMYYVHIYQILFLLQNKFCTFLSIIPNGAQNPIRTWPAAMPLPQHNLANPVGCAHIVVVFYLLFSLLSFTQQ